MREMGTAACQRHGMTSSIVFMYAKLMCSWEKGQGFIYTEISKFLNIKGSRCII
jgi:hypothetical protein